MRKLTPEDLFAFQLVGAVAVHPHRPLVAYQQQQANRETNRTDSWIMMVEPGHDPRRFTAGLSDEKPRFSPDGKHLAFLSKRSDVKQLWVMPTDGGEPRPVTRLKDPVEDFRWLPDSSGFALLALVGPDGLKAAAGTDPEDLYVKYNRDVKVITESYHKLDGVGYYDERRPHVVIHPLADEGEPRLCTSGPMRHEGLDVSPDGRYVVTASRYGEDYDRQARRHHVYLIDTTGEAPPKRLTDDPLSAHGAVFGPDGRTIYFFATDWRDLGYDNTGIYRTTVDGSPTERVAANWDRPFSDVSTSDMAAPASNPISFDASGTHVYALTSTGGTQQLARVNLATNQVELATTGDQVYFSYALSADKSHAALATTHPLDPGQMVWLDLDSQHLEVLAAPNQALLSELSLSAPERMHARAEGGPELDVWVMKPVGLAAGEKAPTALEIHGGPMMMYSQSFFLEFQWLAANGYGVVYSNPRGSQGYGKDFCIAIQKEWGNLDHEDIMAALDTAIGAHDWIDTSRLGVLGGSYGGYMTNWIVGHTNRFKAAITMRSVVDWRGMVGTGDLGWNWISRAGDEWPWDQNEGWYRQQSPITYVQNITTPLLIEHQEGDLRCPIDQGMTLFTAMKYYDRAPVKFIRYPEEFHGMSRNGKPWHRVYRLNTFTDWFDNYLK